MPKRIPNRCEGQSGRVAGDHLDRTSATGSAALGQAVWLMLRMPMYRHVFLSDLEWMVLPPILLNQFRLFNAGGKVVAFAAWAYLSEEAEARLQQPNPKLAPTNWKSGNRLWLVDMFAPYGHGEAVLRGLAAGFLAGKSFKFHRIGVDLSRTTLVIQESFPAEYR